MNLISKFKKRFYTEEPDAPGTERFFDDLFNYTMYGFIVYTKETLEVVETNKVIRHLFEMPDDKSLGGLYIQQVMLRYLSGDSPNLEILMNDSNKDWEGEALFVSHEKKKFNAYVNTNIVHSDKNAAYRIMSILDISELKDSLKKVDIAQKKMESALKARSRFLNSVSHELRTPLNGVIGASNLLLEDNNLSADSRENIALINYSSEHMLSIVNNILDFSKIEVNKISINEKNFNLLNCLKNIISSFRLQFKEKDIELRTDFSQPSLELLNVLSDETKLMQILKNLLSNALKFTIRGWVCLTVKIEEMTDSEARVRFEIVDTGIGIAKDKQEEIFHAFTQIYNEDLKRAYEGTGLGLSISSRLVKMLGGSLSVESEYGEGAKFIFTIPLKKATEKAPESPAPAASEGVKKDIRGVRVLIVEDNEVNARILRSFLTRWQLPVKEAITGKHALELMKFHKFDLILMDLEMPEMNGFTALKRIREMNIQTPVIAFTATLLDDMNSLITDAGFTDYLTKPFKPAELRKKIEMYCERKVDYV